MQIYQVENVCEEEMPEESDCVHMARTPTPPTLSPPAITLGNGEALNSEDPLSGENKCQIKAAVLLRNFYSLLMF